MKNYTTPSIKIAVFSQKDAVVTASREADMAAFTVWKDGLDGDSYTRKVLFEEVQDFYD